jgi:lipooligosaccharide transport system permease protein
VSAEAPPRAVLGLRVWPVAAFASGRGRRLVARNLRVQRRHWWVVASGFAEPFFYLLSIGIGLGHLVGRLPGPHGTRVSYAAYVAPALLASSAMNGGITEATFNVFHKLRFTKIYTAVLATPLGPADVARGEIGTALLRGSVYGAAFVAIMAALGDMDSPWGILALAAAVLIGFAFAATGMAVTTYMRGWGDFDLLQLVILPLFLFSTTFYPLGTYPRWLQLVVECTPLYQGVDLCRTLCLGDPGTSLVGPVVYLAVMGVVGLAVTSRRVEALLLR